MELFYNFVSTYNQEIFTYKYNTNASEVITYGELKGNI